MFSGSRRFRRLINQGSFEEASEVGRRQVRNGAHVLDVCLQDPDRDEIADIIQFLDRLTRKVKTPIMIDSTDAAVIEESLKWLQGKSIINSINLEDGEARFKSVIPMAKRYGAALVVGCIDDDKEQAQAISRQRKLEVALRSHQLLTEKYGVLEHDIIFDPLVFPAGTGDVNYLGSAAETIEGVHLIKEALPNTKTILGISNVSFGPPDRWPGGLQLRFPLPLRPSRTRFGHRQLRGDAALCFHPGTGASAFRRPDLEPWPEPGGRIRFPLPRQASQGDYRRAPQPPLGGQARLGHNRGHEGGSRRGLG